MNKKLRGVVHGRTVELDEDPGIPDGESVEVIYPASKRIRTGEGILNTAGILADFPEWDEIMQEIHAQRKLERRPQLEDWGNE
jgi:hypothetical protein